MTLSRNVKVAIVSGLLAGFSSYLINSINSKEEVQPSDSKSDA